MPLVIGCNSQCNVVTSFASLRRVGQILNVMVTNFLISLARQTCLCSQCERWKPFVPTAFSSHCVRVSEPLSK